MVSDECRSVVEINAQQGKWQVRADVFQRIKHPDLRLVDDRSGFRPAARHVRHIKGLAVVATAITTIMPNQVYLHKPRLLLVPIRKGADRDLVFEQGSGLGAGTSP